MDKEEVALWLVIFLFAFTFCGSPDLHDKVLEKIDCPVQQVYE